MLQHDPWALAADARTAHRWRRPAANWNSSLTQALIDSADLQPDSLVLDVAAGSGDPAIDIAQRASGVRVAALDKSRSGLVTAQQEAQNLGLAARLWFVQADVHNLPFPSSCFDRVTCRFGIMFFDDTNPALSETLRVLKRSGRAAFLAWGAFEQPLFESTIGTVLRLIPNATVPNGARRMFHFATPGSLQAALHTAGFRAVEERHLTLSRIWTGSLPQLWEYQQEVSTLFHPMLQAIGAALRPHLDEAVCAALGRFQQGDTITIPVHVVLATGQT